MSRVSRMRESLQNSLAPILLEIEDESHKHAGPRHESHFKILTVSSQFEGKSRVDRQRLIMNILSEEFKTGLHALTQKNLTPQEYDLQKGNLNFISPPCRGS